MISDLSPPYIQIQLDVLVKNNIVLANKTRSVKIRYTNNGPTITQKMIYDNHSVFREEHQVMKRGHTRLWKVFTTHIQKLMVIRMGIEEFYL